jgi:hypothetical protein
VSADSQHSIPDPDVSDRNTRPLSKLPDGRTSRRYLHVGAPAAPDRVQPPAQEPFAADASAGRVEVIVSYERFAARRRLRQRVAAELTRRGHTTPDEEM